MSFFNMLLASTSNSSGGATLNIAYGDIAPEDTSKLWIKTNEPSKISINNDFEGVESFEYITPMLPTTVSGLSCARVGKNVYMFGGSAKIYKFNLETGDITTLSSTLKYYSGVVSVAIGTKIYLFGGSYYSSGWYGTNTIRVFDAENENAPLATLSATLPQSRNANMGYTVIGTKIYLFGGSYSVGSSTYTEDKICIFDTQTETLTTLTTKLPVATSRMSCAPIGTKIYLFGGANKSNSLKTINVFDTETQEIVTLDATLPTSCYEMGCGVVGTKIYLLGGRSYEGTNTYLDQITAFDAETEVLTTLVSTLPGTWYSAGSITLDNNIYLFGGYINDTPSKRIGVFTITHELAHGDIEIQSDLLKNRFKLINTSSASVEIGVNNVYAGNTNNKAEHIDAYLHDGTDWKNI